MNGPTCNWNTYSGVDFVRLLKLPEKYELRLALFLPQTGLYTSRFLFHGEGETDPGRVARIHRHAPYGEYRKLHIYFHGHSYEFTAAAFGDGELALSCKPLSRGEGEARLLLEVGKIWDEGEIELSSGAVRLPLTGGGFLTLTAGQAEGGPPDTGLYTAESDLMEELRGAGRLNRKSGKGRLAVMLFDGACPLDAAISRGCRTDLGGVEEALREAARSYTVTSPASSGLYGGGIEALNTTVNSQVVWDEAHSLFYTPVTRYWIDFYLRRLQLDPEVKGPVLGLWDCLFSALLHTCRNPEAAAGNLLVLFHEDVVTGAGYPPNYVAGPIKSGDRSQPPLGSLVAWKVYRKYGDRQLLSRLYPYLLRWHRWWPQARDGNGDGLLEWGSDDCAPGPGNDAGTLFGAKCESGMDNSPLFDEAVFDEKRKVMNLNSVFLNSLFAADCLYLAKIAAELGFAADSRALQEEYLALKDRINNTLWSEKDQNYLDRYWDGTFSRRLSPASFFPLLARIPDHKRAERMVRETLLSEAHFWGEYVFPSISKSDPAFSEQLYWRGRIWPPLNYLIYAGLKEYGFDDAAAKVALKSYNLFMREWREQGHCHENYNALTGLGCDVPGRIENYGDGFMGNIGSDPFYTWGALLLLPAVEELLDADPQGGLRFGGSYGEGGSALKNLHLGGSAYSIRACAARLEVFKDGAALLSAAPAAYIRCFEAQERSVRCRLKGFGRTVLTLHTFSPEAAVRVWKEGLVLTDLRCGASGELKAVLELDSVYREFCFESL